ncbi:hypothetical protein HPB49_003406 [Dermacentor silvarum]|uniref:Uncharacterized protein n=1 Tax=Dermacentor silvarum TaxID=543639 RepID=A0ACB8C716_DERSI|nr:hypothetical protein HPB49_003406 [Dermacentor silvarum]
MPCKCCVPRCRGNYTGDTKVHVFKFPRDQALRDAWIRAVPRENLTVTEHSRGPSQQECDQLLKYGYGLSRKALYPSSLERQDVKLALQIFNDYLPEALRALGAKHNLFSFEATATFVEIILKWWKIVNVKTPWKGERLRDHFQQPALSIDNDPKIDFLHMFLKWLDECKNKCFDNGTLTKETHAALEHTTYALVELARYSFEELGMSYVLFGKIQTDCLEDRFGKYRQLAGAQYHISIRQIYEVENKLRLQSTLPTVSPDQHWECVRKQVEALLPSSNVVVTSQALTKMQDVVPVLVYVAGYAVYGTLRKLKCEQCRDSLTVDKKITVSATNEHYGLVKQLDRGEHESVEEASVVGVPDERLGEELCAWVRLAPGVADSTTEQQLRDHCKRRVNSLKVPKYIEIVEDFPRTSVGKISKPDIRSAMARKLGLQS